MNTRSSNILVADSCACGLGVLGELLRCSNLPPTIFLADGEKNPFGLKTESEIRGIVEDWLRFFTKRPYSIGSLVIACNTASTAIRGGFQEDLERRFKVSITGMVEPAVGAVIEAAGENYSGRIAVLGTRRTIESKLYQELISSRIRNANVKSITCTKMEHVVARGDVKTERATAVVEEELAPFAGEFDYVLLGCTCFSFLNQRILDALSARDTKPVLIDPARNVAQDAVRKILERYVSARDVSFSADKPLVLATGGR